MADVYHMFDDTENSYTLYIGRPTCHYCRDFSLALKEFNALTGSQLYYYNTDRQDFTPAAKNFLTKKTKMFAIPTTLYIDKGQIISGWVGSGITSQDLYNQLYRNIKQDSESSTQEIAIKDRAAVISLQQPAASENNNAANKDCSKISESGRSDSNQPHQKRWFLIIKGS
ncbi:hypothetical protein ACVR0O_00335 [Streptococcus caviae]|uniref:hypothetical protein n=1 Tax=Streptococcus sp. 'caviae' TaxID=1915004 RepID=UPI00115642FC|nr:hypothetical protein [Streptococcus sp. 'caviae']